MEILEEIRDAFPKVESEPLSDDFIESHENLLEIESDFDHFAYVPAYMLWVVRNKDKGLVEMYTTNALAEYGRCKQADYTYLNFKHRCNSRQRTVVRNFLNWCAEAVLTSDTQQIKRALKNW
ncbi:hypothetical protein [Neptuniibacter sp. QD48_11]|uniref:hypothetical protein n=1 Tax=Neptuniibacter sp. QD48_11 TaxID=3398211 RepID=UPI0039F57990